MAPLYDAHLHLQDERLRPHLDEIAAELRRLDIRRWVVNGTCEADWPEVARLAETYPEVLPAYGLHPWFIKDRSDHWEETLSDYLSAPERRAVAVGEIGLDKWIRDHRIDEQEAVFRRQLRLAAAAKLPPVIHCLKAWGRLLEVLKSEPLPERGFLLHSFAGPVEMLDAFLELGAYFSFSGYFLQERKAAVVETFRQIPRDRILLETDAPDMLPPEDVITHSLSDEEGNAINHPANLRSIAGRFHRLHSCRSGDITEQVAGNFDRLFDQ